MHLFVYGTLKRGQHNHHFLTNAQFLGEDVTELAIYDLGAINHTGGFPILVKNGNYKIVGEVYKIDKDILQAIDRLEGHPNFYKREVIKLESGKLAHTYIFTLDREIHDVNIIEQHGTKYWHDLQIYEKRSIH